jgi:hypothetical protein
MTLTTNPYNQRNLMNFLSTSTLLRVAVSAEIPLKLNVNNLTVIDTVSFAGLPFAEGIKQFTIRANVHNGFPLDASVFLHFLNENKGFLDSLKLVDVPGGIVGPDGRVAQASISQPEINLSEEQIRHLVDTRYFKIAGIVSTSGNDNIGIYETGENEGFLRVMIGCRLRASGGIIEAIQDFFNQNE